MELGGPVQQPVTIAGFIPQSGTRNTATGVVYEIRCGYGQLQHSVQYLTFLFEYSLWRLFKIF
jgi:hypothetical protein